MIIYLLLYFIIFIFAVFDYVKINIPSSRTLLFIILWCLSGLRSDVGIDTPVYRYAFNHANSIQAFSMEPIYRNLNYFFSSIGFSDQIFFLYTSFFTLFFIFRFLERSKYFFISLLMFVSCQYFMESLNLARQYVAISVSVYSYNCLIDKKRWKYLLFCGLSICFHFTAILPALFMPILFKCKVNKIVWFIGILGSLLFGNHIIKYMLMFFSLFIKSGDKYSTYLYTKDIVKVVTNTGLYRVFLNILALFFIVSYKTKYKLVALQIFLFGVILYNLFYYFDVGIRFSLYFLIFIVLLVAECLICFDKYLRVIVLFFIIGGYLLFTSKKIISPEFNPYNYNLYIFK